MTTQQLLAEAIAARHALLVGKAAVSVGFGERRVEYTQAKLRDLESYIAELRRTLSKVKPIRNRITYLVPN